MHKAKSNDGEALYDIGKTYHNMINYAKALAWYRKSADQNHSSAQYEVASLYNYERDFEQAIYWYLRAVESGEHRFSQLNISSLYSYGYGVPQDTQKSSEWNTKTANQAQCNAQYDLGVICEEGKFKDLQKAVNWYKKAADNGFENAETALKRLNEQGYFPTYDIKLVKEQMRKLEESFQLKLDLLQQDKNDNEVLQQRLLVSEQKLADTETEKKDKDKEIKQLKMALAQAQVALDGDANKDICYDSSGPNSDNEDGSEGAVENVDKDEEDDYQNDINYDSPSGDNDDDCKNDLNYDSLSGDDSDDCKNDPNYDSPDTDDLKNDLNYDG